MAASPISNSALLLVDVQKQYYSKDDGVNKAFPAFGERIKYLLSAARQKSQSKNFHIIHIREIDNDESLWINWWDEMNPQRPAIKAQGLGEEFCKVVNEKLIIKRTLDAFHKSDLQQYLQANNIKTLYICGLITRMCVLNTVLSAFNRGYRTHVISNCCADGNKKHHYGILNMLHNHMAKVLTLDKFVKECLEIDVKENKSSFNFDVIHGMILCMAGVCIWRNLKKQN